MGQPTGTPVDYSPGALKTPPTGAAGSPADRLDTPATRLLLGVVVVYTLAWVTLHHFQFQTPYLAEPDCYFHMKTAWLMRTRGTLEAFPWAVTSTWRDAYFNKDFGFHVLLIPFTWGDLIGGGKLAAVTYGAGIYATLYAVLRMSGVRHAWVWVALLACSGGFFGYRSNVPRPQLISMILSLWAMFFVSRRAWFGLLVVCAAYALCYTAPHVALGYAVIFWAAWAIRYRRYSPVLPIAAAVGIGVGWLLHPNFPNNFHGWWVQNVGALIGGPWSSGAPDLGTPMELQPATTRNFLVQHAALYVAALGAFFLVPRLRDRLEPRLVSLFVIANGYLVMTAFSKRFVEYLLPFSIWLLAEVYTRGLPELRDLSRRLRMALIAAVAVVLAAGGAYTWRENTRTFKSFRLSNALPAAMWLMENTPRDSLVFTCDWDDTPELYFFNHLNRYLVFLDPTYMHHWRPGLWRAWRLAAEGRDADPVLTIREGFGAAGGYCTGEYEVLRRQLILDPRAEVVGQAGEGFVFRFVDPTGAPEGRPE